MNGELVYIGIDTSNYTTSLALVSESGEVIANLKAPLPVKSGERGLRQSDAVFAHTVNVPGLASEIKKYLSAKTPVCIGVSSKPRNSEGSYMPCFLVGVSVAEALASFLDIPIYRFSHQCGHIMAAVYSSGRTDLLGRAFPAFHVSGGTTELVRVEAFSGGFNTKLLGGSADLNAGQVIDRIGVYFGLPFPAGRHLEELALSCAQRPPKKKVSISSLKINLSGLENMAIKLYKDTSDKPLVAAFVFDYIGRSLLALREEYERMHGKGVALFAGGVMCNSIIKNIISDGGESAFAAPDMSSDNAVGIALLAMHKYKSEKADGYKFT